MPDSGLVSEKSARAGLTMPNPAPYKCGMRKRSARILGIKDDLRERIQSGRHGPGCRFMSNQAVANRYGVCYRTAHRLLQELGDEGLLVRMWRSGSFLPGISAPSHARLIFSQKARRVDNPQNFTLVFLEEGLRARKIRFCVTYWNRWRGGANDEYFVFYGNFQNLRAPLGRIRQGLYMNVENSPIPRDIGSKLDVIGIDFRHAGRLAAQFFLRKIGRKARVAVIRNEVDFCYYTDLCAGFSELCPTARHFADLQSGRWELGDLCKSLAREGLEGALIQNDKAAVEFCNAWPISERSLPRIVCYDPYSFAERRKFAVVAAPYKDIAAQALETIRRRMQGDDFPPGALLLKPALIDSNI